MTGGTPIFYGLAPISFEQIQEGVLFPLWPNFASSTPRSVRLFPVNRMIHWTLGLLENGMTIIWLDYNPVLNHNFKWTCIFWSAPHVQTQPNITWYCLIYVFFLFSYHWSLYYISLPLFVGPEKYPVCYPATHLLQQSFSTRPHCWLQGPQAERTVGGSTKQLAFNQIRGNTLEKHTWQIDLLVPLTYYLMYKSG